MLILYPVTLLNSLISSRKLALVLVFVDSLGVFYMDHPIDSFSFQSVWF